MTDWRRSSACTQSGNCPEVAVLANGDVLVRNSNQPDVIVHYTAGEWADFLTGAKAGEFDTPTERTPQ